MRKITTIEKEIVTFTNKSEQTMEARAFEEMVSFWKTYDTIFLTNHEQIIKTIYHQSHCEKSCVYKSLKANVSERTLTRYRKKYVLSYYAIFEQYEHD